MPNFTFTARDGAGQWHNGSLVAENATELAGVFRAKGWSLVKADVEVAVSTRVRRRGILSPKSFDVEIGLSMISHMLSGGLPLMSALKTCSDQARRPRMAVIWDDVHDRVAGGMPFAEALSRHKIFPQLVVQLVRAGELSGNLDVVLEQASDQLERKRNLMVTVTSALMYPAITTVLAIGVASFMMIKVIPEISQFLISQGRKLPVITQMLITVSQFINANLAPLGILFVATGIGVFLGYRWPPAAYVMDRFLLRVPIVGKLLRLGGTILFARSLSMLLEAGVPMLTALETAGGLMRNKAIARRVQEARRLVLAGHPLARPLAASTEFMPMLQRMVVVGEETGTLSSVLNKVALFHEKQLESFVKWMTVLIEPVMTVVIGSMVGFVYIAFFVALYSISLGG